MSLWANLAMKMACELLMGVCNESNERWWDKINLIDALLKSASSAPC